jgi:hypothetical protein
MEQSVWRAFLSSLEDGSFGTDKVQPYENSLKKPMANLAWMLWRQIPRNIWPENPVAESVENRLVYRVDFEQLGTTPFYFSFTVHGSNWFLSHVETIRIPLEMPRCPISSFPDLPEDVKAFMREEIAATEVVRILNYIRNEHGWGSALDWIKDGRGYALAARAWVTRLPQHLAFVLYVCWEQQRLRGSQVTLIELTETSATLRMKPAFLDVYAKSAHLRQMIAYTDYTVAFRTIWSDRAENAGWALTITYENPGTKTDQSGEPTSDSWVRFEFRLAGLQTASSWATNPVKR